MARHQQHQGSCGSAALANALLLIRSTVVSEERIIALAATSWDGTSPKGIMKAAKKLGLVAEKLRLKTFPSDVSDACVILVDQEAHYIATQRMASGRWLVIDSAHNELCWSVTQEELALRAATHGIAKPYTIIVLKEATATKKS